MPHLRLSRVLAQGSAFRPARVVGQVWAHAWVRAVALALASTCLLPPGADAADLLVTVRGVASDAGQVMVAACPAAAFPNGACRFLGRAPAHAGTVEVPIPGLPEGRWGLSAYHDADGDGRLGKDWLGRPTEGVGFGNDAPITRFGPPDFDAASIAAPAAGPLRTAVTLRYR